MTRDGGADGEARITIGGRSGRGGRGGRPPGNGHGPGAGRGRRGLRALAAVLALGAGAGGGAVLGLWAALSWALSGPRGPGASPSPGAVLLAGALGVLAGALLGAVLAGAAVVAGSALRRRPKDR